MRNPALESSMTRLTRPQARLATHGALIFESKRQPKWPRLDVCPINDLAYQLRLLDGTESLGQPVINVWRQASDQDLQDRPSVLGMKQIRAIGATHGRQRSGHLNGSARGHSSLTRQSAGQISELCTSSCEPRRSDVERHDSITVGGNYIRAGFYVAPVHSKDKVGRFHERKSRPLGLAEGRTHARQFAPSSAIQQDQFKHNIDTRCTAPQNFPRMPSRI